MYKWHLNLAAPVLDENNHIKMWVGVTTEIQQQKEQREELEMAITERTQSLLKVNLDLEHTLQNLEQFAYVASHDLQEPLRKIQTFAARILEKEADNLSNKGKDMFYRMKEASKRMQILIQDLLSFSRLSHTEEKFKNSNLRKIIEEVKEELKLAIKEKQATIEVSVMCEVKIIPFQFKQLMQNFISNALKFSKVQIPPHIIINSHSAKGIELANIKLSPEQEYSHINISDNGIGFQKEYSEKIFEVFQRLHTKEEYAGTGIGLAIVKKIVENHNGIITANSEPYKGSTFDIYIPVL